MKHCVPMIILAVIAGFGAVPSASSAPNPAVASAEAKLAGASSRRWILTSIVVFMDVSEGQKCSQGEAYTFSAQHQVDITRCVGGRLRRTTGTWAISAASPYDLVVTLSGQPYDLSFKDSPGKRQLRLRERGSGVASPTHDRILTLSDD